MDGTFIVRSVAVRAIFRDANLHTANLVESAFFRANFLDADLTAASLSGPSWGRCRSMGPS